MLKWKAQKDLHQHLKETLLNSEAQRNAFDKCVDNLPDPAIGEVDATMWLLNLSIIFSLDSKNFSSLIKYQIMERLHALIHVLEFAPPDLKMICTLAKSLHPMKRIFSREGVVNGSIMKAKGWISNPWKGINGGFYSYMLQ
ncbi:hypothetical protein MRB53_028226 [Persea americana]|uniref:Uncharacterized protein n=1 Tax=Persea americana TaxID=3435 RepID=A0ACC2KFE7_PERAE|nr:hypothetical protein MRB53_028226 [Persea americana]